MQTLLSFQRILTKIEPINLDLVAPSGSDQILSFIYKKIFIK